MFTGTYTLVTGNYPQLKDMCKVIFVSFAVLFCTGNTLYSQSTVDRYDNPDITSTYSTHPERPFRYGYPYERDEIIELLEDGFKAYEISAGDNVAEIGAASGWLTAAFSVLSDSVTYYIQDIDTNLLNQTQFDAVIKHFSEQRLTKQTNNFHFVVGSETSTNLPEELFDIIIINNSFHEFSETSSMMDDIVKKLKPRGRLVIHESFANDDMKVHHSGCNIKAYKVSEVEELLAPSGLYLTKMEYPRSSTINYLTFETNVIKSEKYLDGLIEIEPLFTNLKVLNSKRICSSRKKMSLVLNNLEVDFEKIIEYFPSMRPYFFSLADEYQKLNKHKCAVQVLETCVRLYPDDPASRILLADAYYLLYRDDLAIDCYQYVANLDSTNTSVRADLIMSYIRIKSFDNAFHEYQMALMIDTTDDYLYNSGGDLCLGIITNEEYPFKTENQTNDNAHYRSILDYDDLLIFALDAYTKAIKINCLIPIYYISRAAIHKRLFNYEQALEDYDYAIYLNPNDHTFYGLRAEIKWLLDDEKGYLEDRDRYKSTKKKQKSN